MRRLLALYSFAIFYSLEFLISSSAATTGLPLQPVKSTTDIGVGDDKAYDHNFNEIFEGGKSNSSPKTPKRHVEGHVSQTDNDTVYASNSIILGLTTTGDLLAVAFADRIVFINTNKGVFTVQTVIQLPESLIGDIVEFKLFNSSTLFICDITICRLCTVSSPVKCFKYYLSRAGEKEIPKTGYSVNAVTASDGTVVVRPRFYNASSTRDVCAIFKYDVSYNKENSIRPGQYAYDIRWESDHAISTGFSRSGFTYFVGSAKRYVEPIVLAKFYEDDQGRQAPYWYAVRITRICDRDQTPRLDSRMDLTLKCPNFGMDADGQLTCDAAVYNSENDRLTVVLRPLWKNQNVTICSFDMKHVANEFEKIWDECQNETYETKHVEKFHLGCYNKHKIEELPDECFKMTHAADEHNTARLCARYGEVTEAFGNCELSKYKGYHYTYGWIEDYKPFDGKYFARLFSDTPSITWMQHLHGDDGLLTLNERGILMRISSTNGSVIWEQKLPVSSSVGISIDPKQSRLFYAAGKEVKSLVISCRNMYDSCESLERINWSDPLHCKWCEQVEGMGYAVSSLENCSDESLATSSGTCQPFSDHVTASADGTGRYQFVSFIGKRLDRLKKNAKGKVCNFECSVTSVGEKHVICNFKQPVVLHSNCTAYLDGKEVKAGIRALISPTPKPATDTATTIPPSKSSSKSKTKKAAAAVACVVIFIALICLIVWIFYRYRQKRGKRLWQSGTESGSQLPFGAINGTPFPHASVESNPYTGHKGNGYPLKKFNPYERLYLEIDPKLKINLEDIEIGEEIGKGNFGVVYKGIYHDGSGGTREVACKTIDSHNDGVVCGVSEFLREGLTMANFHHPHVTQLIGISLSITGCPMIVTDYLANGDLRYYIVNPNNRLTYGNMLDFGIQIADGMAYLHEKKFIHRDLAARNCMLDAKLTVKIADFGLSRDVSRCGMYEAMNKNRGIPIRWMPIESLEEQQYTFKGDVWAYGVVLWELATRGLIPYADLDMVEILRLLKLGHRLSKPKGCPDILYQKVMLVCWMEDPQRRPTFYELKEMMKDVVEQLKSGISGTSLLNNHYERVSNRSAATTPVSYPKPFPAGPVVTDL